MSNSVNLSLDVTKTGIQNPLIKVRQGDGGFETLHTTVTSNGEPMDLQDWTITFMGTTAGNHKIVDGNVTLVEAPNGIFDYTPSKVWGMDIGEFKIAYFKFVKGDGSASSANFRVSVIEAVDLTQEEAQNYISVVDTTIAEINQHLTESLANVTQSIADANANANTVASNVTTLGNRVDDYNNKLAAIRVGGRNYFLKSAYTLSASGSGNDWYTNFDSSVPISKLSNNVITLSAQFDYDNITSPSGKRMGFEISAIKILPDGTRQDIYFNIWVYPELGSSFHGRKYSTYSLDNTSIVGASSSSPTQWIGGLYIQGVAGDGVSVSNPKIEIGNVATDWTPAPEDAPSNDQQLVHKTGTETIAGDKTFTSPINGQLSGNAATATKWQTARTLALTGDVTGSVEMDGSGNVSMETTGADLVHKTGLETIAGDKTFTGQLNTSALKIAGDDYTNTASATANYFGATISFVRIGRQVTFTSSANAFNTSVDVGLTNNVLPNGFKPALQQNVDATNQDGANKFFSFDPSGSVYSYSAYTSGTQPRISGTYITTDAWPV